MWVWDEAHTGDMSELLRITCFAISVVLKHHNLGPTLKIYQKIVKLERIIVKSQNIASEIVICFLL